MEKLDVFCDQIDFASHNETDLVESLSKPDYVTARIHSTRKHLYNHFVSETDLKKCKNMLKTFKYVREKLINKLRLHLGRQLLVKIELFDDHVWVRRKRYHEALIHLLGEGC